MYKNPKHFLFPNGVSQNPPMWDIDYEEASIELEYKMQYNIGVWKNDD